MLRVTGLSGQLRVGYQVAAELGPWRLELAPQLPRQYEVHARVYRTDAYWLSERPMTLTLDVGSDVWAWAVAEPEVGGHELMAIATGTPAIWRGAARQKEAG